jgi:hypothetical protein
MTEEEKQTSEELRGNLSKGALSKLYAIYNKYNTQYTGCWCSSQIRIKKNKEYYDWYDTYTNTNN